MRRVSGYWQVAGIYACAFGAVALTFPYMNQYLLELGFSGVQIGSMFAAASLLGLLLTLLASALADRSGRHRSILWAALLTEMAALGCLSFAPVLVMVGGGVVVMRAIMQLDMAMRDRLTLHWISEHPAGAYGGLRLWGSLGFALVGIMSGPVAERFGTAWLFAGAGLMLIGVLIFSRVYAARLPVGAADAAEAPAPAFRRIGRLSPVMAVIMATALVSAVGQSGYFGWNYEFIDHGLGGGKSAVGLYASLAALIEAPVMLLADRLLRRHSAALVWGAGLLIWGAGWLLLSLVRTPLQAMVLTIPAGIAQGFVLVAPVVFVGQSSPAHNTAFYLALMGTCGSLGMMVGSSAAGWIYDALGVRVLLRLGGAAVMLAAVVLWTGVLILRRRTWKPRPTA